MGGVSESSEIRRDSHHRRSVDVSLDSPWNPTKVAINGNVLPAELVEALDSGRWMELSGAGAQLIASRFGIRPLYPDFYDYVKIVRATEFFVSADAAGYWLGGLDPHLDMDPQQTVLIGDLVGAGEDFLALDYRSASATVRLLTDDGWVHVARSVTEFLDQLSSDSSPDLVRSEL